MRRTAALILVTLGFAVFLRAQTKPPVTPADYGQFETLAPAGFGNASGGLSPDGKWLAYGINRSNRSNELRITNIGDGTTKTHRVRHAASFLVGLALGRVRHRQFRGGGRKTSSAKKAHPEKNGIVESFYWGSNRRRRHRNFFLQPERNVSRDAQIRSGKDRHS